MCKSDPRRWTELHNLLIKTSHRVYVPKGFLPINMNLFSERWLASLTMHLDQEWSAYCTTYHHRVILAFGRRGKGKQEGDLCPRAQTADFAQISHHV